MTNKKQMLVLLGLLLPAASALAQSTAAPEAGAVRLRGTIDTVGQDGMEFTVRGGAKMNIALPGELRVNAMVPSRLSDIQPGSYIGSAAVAQPDGTLRALGVTILPSSMRGVGEGTRPWNVAGSTMTNGTVGQVTGADGNLLVVNDGTGEKRIVVPAGVPVVALEPADRAMMQPGAHVVVSGQRNSDGLVTARSVSVGKDGFEPPL